MKQFATRYLRALMAVTTLMLLCWLGTSPWMNVPSPTIDLPPEALGEIMPEGRWHHLFPPGAWQRANPKMILTSRGVLLAQKWEQIDAQTWQLQPLTIVMPVASIGREALQRRQFEKLSSDQVWVITASDGATIHFDEPLDLTSPRLPRVTHGALGGAVEVSRRAKDPGKQWTIRTREVVIDEGQLSTQHEVTIQWGDSRIVGRDMRLTIHSHQPHGSTHDRPWGPLDALELYHIEQAEIALPPGGLFADWSVDDAPTTSPWRSAPARLYLTAGGRFAFDFNQSVVRLRHGVRVDHVVQGLPADVFECHELMLKVVPQHARPSQPTGSIAGQLGDVVVERIEAVGSEAIGALAAETPVSLAAPTLQATLRAKRLILDLRQQRLDLNGSLGDGAAPGLVEIQYQGHHIQAPRVEYQAAAPDASGRWEHLGWLVAVGAGRIDSVTQQLGATTIEWAHQLRMAPLETEERQWIELTGKCRASQRSPEGVRSLQGERIELWLERVASSLPATPTGSPVDRPRGEVSYRPARMLVTGDAILSDPRLITRVDELEILATYPAPSAAPHATTPDLVGPPVRPPTTLPAPSTAGQLASQVVLGPPATSGPQAPLMLTGQTLVVRAIGSEGSYRLEDMQLEGPLRAWQESSDPFTWHVDGQRIKMRELATGQFEVSLYGNPARIVYGDGYVASSAMHYEHPAGRISIDRPGELLIPSHLLPTSPTAAAAPSGGPVASVSSPRTTAVGMQWLKQPRCIWQQGLEYDGRQLRLSGEVQTQGSFRTEMDSLWSILQRSDTLTLDLVTDHPAATVSLSQGKIERVVWSGNVQWRASQLDRYGGKLRRDQLDVPEATFVVPEQRLLANGPGIIRSRFVATGQSDEAQQLRGANLRFQHQLTMFLDPRRAIFDGKVELLIGTISDWEEDIEQATARHLRPGDLLLTGDQLQVYDLATLGPAPHTADRTSTGSWECVVTGKVAFAGTTLTSRFRGTAARVVYTQPVNRLLVEGAGRSPAMLFSDPLAEGRPFQAAIDSAAVNPHTGEIQDLRIAAGGIQVGPNTPSTAPSQLAPQLPTPSQAPDPRRDFFQRDTSSP
ncbi:MAG: hypothetical protein KatS3mg111_3913 [Pirellulaceae bacterium]|nr:MAG: hypothetical protein KatS3mg111_3913 [Pirellulaceae bacterium]